MLSLKSIETKLKKFEDSSWQFSEEGIIASHKKWGEEDGASEQEIQQETRKAVAKIKKLFEKTKESRYILYQIYFTLKVKYGRDLAKLLEELLPAVIKGNLKQRELEELRAAISDMLEQPTLPHSSGIRKLLEPIIRNYAEGEIKERRLQELEQRRVLAEQLGAEARQRAEVAEQVSLLLQRQILELEQQLQAKNSQKIAAQPEELSPIDSFSGESAQHSPQQDIVTTTSPVITTSFDMGTTSTKQSLLEENPAKEPEQCAPSAKKQCLRPSQDS